MNNAMQVRLPTEASDAIDIDLAQYWGVFRRNAAWILGGSFVLSVIVWFVMQSAPDIYRASATMMLQPQQNQFPSVEQVYGLNPLGDEYVRTELELVRSAPIIRNVLSAQGGDVEDYLAPIGLGHFVTRAKAALGLEPSDPNEADRIDAYADRLDARMLPDTRIIQLNFESTDPQLSADIVNLHAATYIAFNKSVAAEQTEQRSEWMTERLTVLEKNLRDSESKLQAFAERHGVIDVQGIQTLTSQELSDLNAQLVDSRRAEQTAYSTFQQARQLQQSLDQDLDTSVVADDPAVQSLLEKRQELEQDLSELAKRYGPVHPRRVSAETELALVREQLAGTMDKVVKKLQNQYQIELRQRRALERSIEETKQAFHSAGRLEPEYEAALREVETNRQLHDMFYEQIASTSQEQGLERANARLVGPAVVPTKAIGPRRSMIAAFTFILGALVAYLAAVLWDSVNDQARNPNRMSRFLKKPVLALIPDTKLLSRIGAPRGPASLAEAIDSEQAPDFSEAFRSARIAVRMGPPATQPRRLMVASSLLGEGKSTFSAGLALSLSQSLKVLVIDGDMRRAGLGDRFDLDPEAPGLSDILLGHAELKDCVVRLNDNLDILPAGSMRREAAQNLESEQIEQLMRRCGSYDRVLVDAAPVLPIMDTLVWSMAMDSVLYVVRYNHVTLTQAQRGIELLEQSGAQVMGLVLNGAQIDEVKTYGDYGFSESKHYGLANGQAGA